MHTAHATNTRCGRERCADKSGAAESGAAESSADESGADESVRMSERPSGGRGPRCEDAVRAQMRWIARRASAWPAAAARHARARQPFARLPARPFRAPVPRASLLAPGRLGHDGLRRLGQHRRRARSARPRSPSSTGTRMSLRREHMIMRCECRAAVCTQRENAIQPGCMRGTQRRQRKAARRAASMMHAGTVAAGRAPSWPLNIDECGS